MVSLSGIRGIFGDTLTPDLVQSYAAYFGIFCGRGKIVIGRDSRTSGIAMRHSIISGLIAVGCDVVDLGIVPTPTVLISVKDLNACGGISITASHNPPEWNAMKFVDRDGMFLAAQRAEAFFKSMESPILWNKWDTLGKVVMDPSGVERHIEKILGIPYIDFEKIRTRKFRVVIDSVNGAGGLASPLLLKKLGCEVIEINSEPTGVFSHPAEPLNQNLTQLEAAVKEHHADLGFATDPDADRLSLVSEKGSCIGEELSVALAEMFVLPKRSGDIVVNLSTSMLSDDIAARFGVKVHRTRVGEINVGKLMQELRSPIGGEGNGGIICPDVNYTRDALSGMALILGLMAEQEKTLTQLVDELPKYYFSKAKIELKPSQLDRIMEMVPTLYKDYEINTLDGIKVIGSKFWIHIRKSGTEPIIRVYVESDSASRSEEICSSAIKKLTGSI